MERQYKGRLLLGLMFQLNEEPPRPPPPPGKNRKPPRRKGVLHVAIKRAEDLPKTDPGGLTNAVVKCYLLPSRTSSNKRKTQVVMNSLCPVWDEEFVYKTSEKELAGERVLEVTIWDFDKRGSNDFIGGLRIGPARGGSPSQGPDWMDSFGEELSHWQTVLSRPGEWVEQWHTLRPRMDRPITSLPEKPRSRELSPVQERLSPPLEEEEEKYLRLRSGSSSPVLPQARSEKPLQTQSHSPSPIPQLLVTSEPMGDEEAGRPTTSTPFSHSTSSTSLHSAGLSDGEVGKGDYEISGDIQLGFVHQSEKLHIHVNRARDLAAADSNGFSDPYVKTYLLPDHSKSSKRKTGVQRKTLTPVFNETLEYSVSESELSSRTVWLSVWDWDRFGRNQFLGEVRLPLASLDLGSDTELWYPLLDKDQPYNINPSTSQLNLALRFTPRESEAGVTRGSLSVLVKRARNLFPTGEDVNNTPHHCSYVTTTLLPDTSQRRTSTVEKSANPSWKQSFVFEGVTVEEIAKERVLEVSVWDSGDDRFIGGLRTGPLPNGSSRNCDWMDSTGDEVSHWQMVLARPGEWAEQWHALRENMKPTTSMTSSHDTITATSSTGEFRKIDPKKKNEHSPKPSQEESASKTNSSKKGAALSTNSKAGKAGNRRDKSRSPPRHHAEPPVDEFRKTVPKIAKPTTNLDEEFRKVAAAPKALAGPPQKSATLEKTVTSLEKLVDTGPRSSSSLPHSIPPLTLEDIARSGDHLRSRSSSPEMPPSSNVVTPGSTLERSSNQMMQAGPLKRAGLLGVKGGGSRSSLGSQLSIYSSAGGGKGNYDISGEILLKISYHSRDRMLHIHVNRARDLAAADGNGFSDPYVKTYLLPDHSKSSKRKTNIARKTLNPVYNQTLKYIVAPLELNSQTVWLSVWDWDRFGRNQFLGEVRLPLASLDLSNPTECWYTLQDKDEDTGATDFYRGQLNLAIRYTPSGTKKGKTRGSLDVVIKQGRDFPSMGGAGKPDPVVKCYLLPDKSSSGKRKVGVIKNQSDPVWEEIVTYEKVVLEEIAKERVLEVTVWDWDKKGSSFIGGLRIGPLPDGSSRNHDWMDSIGDEVSHWEMVLAHPGEWAEQWHTLRTTMDPRNVSFQ
ncbi:Synaptotagmin-like protein 5 [Geodia barretti]|nr:Synaptotagmin-like protein 5 [Geodia barretti]